MNDKPPEPEETQIEANLNLENELANRINSISVAIDNGMDGISQTKNLLSSLFPDWEKELQHDINRETGFYLNVVDSQKRWFVAGTRYSEKESAHTQIIIAGQEYSRRIKQMVMAFLRKKGFFKHKKEVEQGNYSEFLETTQGITYEP